jgi:hypothetical protein
MKSICKLVFSLSLAAVGLFGLQGSAMALTTINGSICKPEFSNAPGLLATINGALNKSGGTMKVFCPIVRTAAAPAGGWGVFVDGNAASGTISCTLSSVNFDNAFKASKTSSAAGTFDMFISLPQDKVPTFSHQTLVCFLPNNAQLFDIEPSP